MIHLLKISAAIGCVILMSCSKNNDATPCHTIVAGEPFEAKIHDMWCLNDDELVLTVGDLLDDSRCNFGEDVNCFWEGKVDLAVTIEYLNEVQRDTFVAIYGQRDTLSAGQYSIELQNIKPEMRDPDNLPDTSDYRFLLLVE